MAKKYVPDQPCSQPVVFVGDTDNGFYCCVVCDEEVKYQTPPNCATTGPSLRFAALRVSDLLKRLGHEDYFNLRNGLLYDVGQPVREVLRKPLRSNSCRALLGDTFFVFYNEMMRAMNPKLVVPNIVPATPTV